MMLYRLDVKNYMLYRKDVKNVMFYRMMCSICRMVSFKE
jgi:hypothetical protein